ncbi:MAG TPA: Ppx/GppA phosphatase family protein [Methylomusa anaerophila]|uniref:Chaperone protein DnaK n=1 Tax=Methylomusa anaerophila TaxID=1930071 RepID=A0A348AIC1_9FIRM|nr:Ppx/GppA phosphatase family protein [Methylomusa anaerophila]BBB90819.1 exopolyphosphatase [Methylomusa anaerophila]HML90524.1 Ppx/GppA phosphatase family protein [Methylomusa anaerophila]
MTERLAIIDLGSNSARLIVMHIYHNDAYNLVYHQKEIVRLSEGAGESRVLSKEAMWRAINSLKVFAHMCELVQADKILAVATAAVRNAHNGQEFLQLVYQHTGIPLQAISEETEALLGYIGVINTIDVKDALLFDLGGGSTEVTLIRDRQPLEMLSIPYGSLNLTEMFGTSDKITEEKLNEMRNFVMGYLHRHTWLKNLSLPVVGIGGTARNIAKMDQKRKNYPFPKVHNYRLGPMAFEELWYALIKTNLTQRRKFPGLSNERADIIIAGTTIAKSLLDVSRGTSLAISGCGVREGMFLKYYLERKGQKEIIPDILAHSTHNMLLFYKGNESHHYHIAGLAASMFDGWQPVHKLGSREKSLLNVAALLHDIGIAINYYDHARHSAYLVENARLFGLTHREQMLAAVVAGWHSGYSAKYVRHKLYSEFLDQADWQVARRLALILALAESLETTQMGLVRKVEATIAADQAHLKLITDDPVVIERQAVVQHKKWFKKELGVDLVVV